MAREEKPYRVYRGGRAKGKVPSATPRPGREQRDGQRGRSERSEYRGPRARPQPVRWGPRIGVGQPVPPLLIVVWAVASWFAFSGGVSDANKRLVPNAKNALA